MEKFAAKIRYNFALNPLYPLQSLASLIMAIVISFVMLWKPFLVCDSCDLRLVNFVFKLFSNTSGTSALPYASDLCLSIRLS